MVLDGWLWPITHDAMDPARVEAEFCGRVDLTPLLFLEAESMMAEDSRWTPPKTRVVERCIAAGLESSAVLCLRGSSHQVWEHYS